MITMTTDGTKEGTHFTTDGEALKGDFEIKIAGNAASWVTTTCEFFIDLGAYGGRVPLGSMTNTKKAERTDAEMKRDRGA